MTSCGCEMPRYSSRGIAISGCFINPNASCPVCSSPVFYYENKHGSRVFFDDLGPPWPKHPCTDNSIRRIPALQKSDKLPTRRTLGLMQELVTNANIVGVLRGKIFGRRVPSDWTLLIINSVERRDEENIVVAEYLDSLKQIYTPEVRILKLKEDRH